MSCAHNPAYRVFASLGLAFGFVSAGTASAQTVTSAVSPPASTTTAVVTTPPASTTGVTAPPAATGTTAVATTAAAPAPVFDAKAPTDERAWSGRVIVPTVARVQPAARAKVVTRVSPYGPYDNDPQSLLVLESRRVGKSTWWYRVQLPLRPNGTSGWVRGDALQLTATAMRVKVSLSKRTLTIMSNGRPVDTWSVAVGTPTNPTPTGLFAISEIVPQTPESGFFGPFIITTTAHSENLSDFDGGNGVVALHGTSLPGLLGQAVSHGCVRVENAKIKVLAKKVPRGAPVEIVP